MYTAKESKTERNGMEQHKTHEQDSHPSLTPNVPCRAASCRARFFHFLHLPFQFHSYGSVSSQKCPFFSPVLSFACTCAPSNELRIRNQKTSHGGFLPTLPNTRVREPTERGWEGGGGRILQIPSGILKNPTFSEARGCHPNHHCSVPAFPPRQPFLRSTRKEYSYQTVILQMLRQTMYSTAQYGTAQHSTAQYGTVHPHLALRTMRTNHIPCVHPTPRGHQPGPIDPDWKQTRKPSTNRVKGTPILPNRQSIELTALSPFSPTEHYDRA